MFGFSPLDLSVMAAYLGAVVAIGAWTQRRIRTQSDYFLGGRSFGKLLQTFASFGQATSADGPVGVATTTFHNGASGIWSALMLVFWTPMFWVTSPWLRRMRVLTMGDFYAERYGSRRLAATYAVVATVGMMGLLSAGYTAVTKTAVAMMPKPVAALTSAERSERDRALDLNALEARDARTLSPADLGRLADLRREAPRMQFSYLTPTAVVWVICVVTLVNAVMGGLTAAFYTDLLQGVLILILSAILIPFGLARINALHGGAGFLAALATMHARLPESFFEVFGSPQLPDFTWYYVGAVSLVAGITVVTQPNQLVTNAAARDEHAARVGMVTGSFLKRLCTILWALGGLVAAVLYAGTLRDSDLVWGHATRDLLGPARAGLVGLMLVSLTAALMSASNSLMLTISGLVTNNLYRPLFPGRGERHYVGVGRLVGALFLVGGAAVATQFDNLLQVLKFVWEFFVVFAAAFWLGVKWRRATPAGAWASILSAFTLFYGLPATLTVAFPGIRTDPALLLQTEPGPVEHVYTAKARDVAERKAEIRAWEQSRARGAAGAVRPEPLVEGRRFIRVFDPEPRPIFWSQGTSADRAGRVVGDGYPYLELILLERAGARLERFPSALSETLRLLIRLTFPFAVLISVSLVTRPLPAARVDPFFVKMRTPVRAGGAEADARALEAALAAPRATEAALLRPGSAWEFQRWSRRDACGMAACIGFVGVVIALLALAVSLGG